MTGLRLFFVERFDSEAVDALTVRLSKHVEIEETLFIARCSADDLPQYVELIGSWKFWVLTFGAVATAFLAKIGQRAGDAVWDAARAALKREDVKALADVSQALSDVRTSSGNRPDALLIGLDNPGGTKIIIRTSE